MKNREQEAELQTLAAEFAYESLKFSPLWKVLENRELDALAEDLATDLRTIVEGRIERILRTRQEAA